MSGGNIVSVISTRSNRVITTIRVRGEAGGIAITPNGRRVYVTDEHYSKPYNGVFNNVSVISTQSNRVIARVPVSNTPGGVAITPNGKRVYVTEYGGYRIYVINTETNRLINTLTISAGEGPQGIAITRTHLSRSSVKSRKKVIRSLKPLLQRRKS
ncbi:NHL repeat protein [compost metagenome]